MAIANEAEASQLMGPTTWAEAACCPGNSVDEYSATPARWFGLADNEMPSVSPNIGRFAKADLGLMISAT
ncbi:MAG: hypothetical protein WBA68_06555 [Alteraurantiacibacter sp.]